MVETIAIAADHAGYDLKALLVPELKSLGFEVLDLGTDSGDSVDYPDFADALARAIERGQAKRGVLVCGTGLGIAIAANRHRWVRAGVCHDATTARLARQHNDANVLALGARVVGSEVAKDCLRAFLATEFDGGRHARRVAKLS
ncbi:MAG TPA: ribose 5-phosphate isomerase B [Stellaceae bacterium]|jgi:ribose 5-phosphate isomerase B|nr:ribose 5-phosphate isomerase B [Stellaceae bacterium]